MPAYASTFEAAPRQNVVRLDVGSAPPGLSVRDPDRFVAEVGHGG